MEVPTSDWGQILLTTHCAFSCIVKMFCYCRFKLWRWLFRVSEVERIWDRGMQKLCSCNVKMHTFHSKKNDNVDEELFSLVEDLVCFFVLFLFLIGKVDFICTVRMSNIHVTQSSQYYKRLSIMLLGLTMKFTIFQNGDIRLSAIFFIPGKHWI